MQDVTKVLLGTSGSSDRVVTCEDGNPATFEAGLAVCRPTAGGLSLTSGSLIGVSLGKSLSDTKKTSVCRDGNWVPIQLTDVSEDESGDYSYAVAGLPVYVDAVTGKATDDTGTLTGAKYAPGTYPLTGIKEDATTALVALIDMAGGL